MSFCGMWTACRKACAPRWLMSPKSLLKFSRGNAKLGMDVWTFSLLAGHSCPGADKCMARVNLTTHLLEDGPKQEFRCFSATQEVAFSNTRKAHQHNFEKLRGCATTQEMVELLIRSLPKKALTIRVHVSGDFFNQRYFDAWQAVAALRQIGRAHV